MGFSVQHRLPELATRLCVELKAPPRLVAHLSLVHDAACELVQGLGDRFPGFHFDHDALLFGASTHDLGKILHPTELSGPGYLSALPNLRTLNCGGSPINDESLESLSNLQLVSLGLIDTQVTTDGAKHLKTMPTLKHLRLSGTGFTDQGLKQLNRLTALETLMIDRTKVTEVGVRAFKAAVPGCSVRYTSKAGVTVNERGVANGSQVKGNETSVTEPSFAGKYQVIIVNVENGRVQKALQVEIKDDKSLLVSDGTKGEWSVRNKRLVVKAEALFGGLTLTKQPDGSLVGEMVYATNKMRYRMTLTPVGL